MSKHPDWAERKVDAMWKRHGGLLAGDDMVTMLRAERARAVRVCKNKTMMPARHDQYVAGYNQACDDCAAAVKGEK